MRGTPLQNSIKPIDEYLITGNEDLLPSAKNIPTGKQKRIAKIEIMKVKDRPPHSLVGIFSNPKFPPDRSDIKIKGVGGHAAIPSQSWVLSRLANCHCINLRSCRSLGTLFK